MFCVEVTIIGNDSLKIRGKQGSAVINPSSLMQKTQADCVLSLYRESSLEFTEALRKKVEGYRIVIAEPGEYEVASIKIRALRLNGGLLYKVYVDNVGVLIVEAKILNNAQKKESELTDIGEYDLLVLYANDSVSDSVIAELEPKVVILYGNNAKDAALQLGKNEVTPIKKYSLTRDKIPGEMEVVVLK